MRAFINGKVHLQLLTSANVHPKVVRCIISYHQLIKTQDLGLGAQIDFVYLSETFVFFNEPRVTASSRVA